MKKLTGLGKAKFLNRRKPYAECTECGGELTDDMKKRLGWCGCALTEHSLSRIRKMLASLDSEDLEETLGYVFVHRAMGHGVEINIKRVEA
jgi:hypothetical protein